MKAVQPTPSPDSARREYYQRIGTNHLTPLWEVLSALVPPSPRPAEVAHRWPYRDIREQILEAGKLISAEEAERRVLILENPALRGQSCITQSLYAGLQMILPGEVAPAHRHTQSALRLVLEGEGAHTAVEGERATMARGDLIITPAWTWHDHGHSGADPVVWLDVLDIPIVRFLNAGFAEKSATDSQTPTRPEGDSLARYGANLLPIDYLPKAAEASRTFHYPYMKTRAALAATASGVPDSHHGFKFRCINPANGQAPMPTVGVFVQWLPEGFTSRTYRCTDSTIYVCIEGQCGVSVGDRNWLVAPNDVFIVPSWLPLTLSAEQDTVLYSFSDRPVQQVLGLWREQRQ
jgi:gentisate 1,2-dioxygenase